MTDRIVVAVSRSSRHTFSKPNLTSIKLIEGIGVAGDAHAGRTVKHLYLLRKDPTQPNLRQVHLIHAELLDALNAEGFSVGPGQLGENITTRGIDLLGLPLGARLRLGDEAVVEATGLRNPCHQIDDFQKGMLKAVLNRDDEGNLVRKAGVMGVVLAGGEVRPGDAIRLDLPPLPHRRLEYIANAHKALDRPSS
jgi:MOSC domain-containing protein YiiM